MRIDRKGKEVTQFFLIQNYFLYQKNTKSKYNFKILVKSTITSNINFF